MEAELFHADRHDEVHSRFSYFANAPKKQRRCKADFQTFRSLPSATIITYGQITGLSGYHLNCGINLVECLLLRYSLQHEVSGYHSGDKTVRS